MTDYLQTYRMTARELAMTMIQDVLKTTGITATAGIGTNMYRRILWQSEYGVRIAQIYIELYSLFHDVRLL